MGRHYKIPGRGYLSKKARTVIEEKIKRDKIQALPAFERQICATLEGFAIDTLQAAGRGEVLDERLYMRKITQVILDHNTNDNISDASRNFFSPNSNHFNKG